MVEQKQSDLKKRDSREILKEEEEHPNKDKQNCSTDPNDWCPGDGPHPSD